MKRILPLLLLSPAAISAQTPQAADSLFANFNAQSPGISVTVMHQGRTVLSHSRGMARIGQAAADSLTRYWAASVTKQFTAAAVYRLESEGKLQIHASIRQYLPGLPEAYAPVTLYHLIHHTSGIRDGFVLTSLSKKTAKHHTSANVLKYTAMQQSLGFAPGTAYEYNNGGYVLLALIAEKAAGMPLPDYLREQFFEPLQMHRTVLTGDYFSGPQTAEGYKSRDYTNKPGSFVKKHFSGSSYGSTGLVTSAADLARWAAFVASGKIPALLEPGKLHDGSEIAYCGGLEKFSHNGRVVYEHFGADEGHKANVLIFPESDLVIAGLVNNATYYTLSKQLYALADIFHHDAPPAPNPPPANGPAQKLAFYDPSGLPMFRQVSLQDTRATLAAHPIAHPYPYYVSGDRLWNDDMPAPQRFRLHGADSLTYENGHFGETRTLKAVELSAETADLSAFSGKYHCPELGTSYKIRRKGGRLYLVLNLFVKYPLYRINETDFMMDESGTNFIRFSKDGFVFSREGVRNLRFSAQR